jgi:uncharacterized protein
MIRWGMGYAAAGALIIGVTLGLLGSGGGILTVPVLVYLVGHPEKQAIAESLLTVGTISMVGAVKYASRGRVRLEHVGYFGLPSMIGAYLGAVFGIYIPGTIQLILLSALMLLAARLLLDPMMDSKQEVESLPVRELGFRGFSVGIFTGLLGVGGGFLIVPSLILMSGLKISHAVGTSLAVIFLNCIVGFWKHYSMLDVHGLTLDWEVVALFCGFGLIGSEIGQLASTRLNPAHTKRIFAIFLLLLAFFMGMKELSRLVLNA